jgi:hypothetical protein
VPAIYFLFYRQGQIYYIGKSINVFKRICNGHFKTLGKMWTKLSILALPPNATPEQLKYAETMFIYSYQHKRSRNKHGKIMAPMGYLEMIRRLLANFEETLMASRLIKVTDYINEWKRRQA